MKSFLIIMTLLAAQSLRAQSVPVVVYEDIIMRIPKSTRALGHDRPIEWSVLRSLTDYVRDSTSLKLMPDSGIAMEIWVHEEAEYATQVNTLSRLRWLAFVTQMLQARQQEVRQRSRNSSVALTGDYVGRKYRAVLARSSWLDGALVTNVVVYDIFHGTTLVSFLFTWTGPEGGEPQRIVDDILSSIAVVER